jgi:Bacterial conjugation TrbI-like protein
MHPDDELDPYRPEKELRASKRPWRPIMFAAGALLVVGGAIAFDVKVVGPWWPFGKDDEPRKEKNLLAGFDVNAPDWEPTPPAVPEPVVLSTIREVHIPAMTMEAAPPPAAPPPPPSAPAVQVQKVSIDGPMTVAVAQIDRPLDMVDGRMSAQAQGCALMPGQPIYASMVDEVRWDLGGQITAHVTRAVVSPERPANVLIPQGATLVGQANPEQIKRGTDLAPAPVWQTVWWIDSDTGQRRTRNLQATGANIAGVNGIGGEVDQKWGPVIALMAVTTVTDFVSSISVSVGDSESVNARIGGSSAGRIAEKVAEQLLSIEPTIRTQGGTQIIVKPTVPIRMC